jgi:hypothetical protein
VLSANPSFCSTFAISEAQSVGRRIYELGDGAWSIPELRRLLKDILPEDSAFDDFEVTHQFPKVGRVSMHLNARRMESRGARPAQILLSFRVDSI